MSNRNTISEENTISQFFVSMFLLNSLTLLRIRAGSAVNFDGNDVVIRYGEQKGVNERPLGPTHF